MEMFWVMLFKPFLVMACLVIAYPVTRFVRRFMPPGRVKAILLDRTLHQRKPWIGWAFCFGGIAFAFVCGFGALWLRG